MSFERKQIRTLSEIAEILESLDWDLHYHTEKLGNHALLRMVKGINAQASVYIGLVAREVENETAN